MLVAIKCKSSFHTAAYLFVYFRQCRRCIAKFAAVLSLSALATFFILGDKDGETVVELPRKKFTYPKHSTVSESLIWAVNIDGTVSSLSRVNEIAEDLGLLNVGQVGDFENHFVFAHKLPNSSNVGFSVSKMHLMHTSVYNDSETSQLIVDIEKKLEGHQDIIWFAQQRILPRSKRSRASDNRFMDFVDPYYRLQWHLVS